ncbi:uncharacterized protein ACJ7VT_003753 [Polymixia lowei]
MGDPLSDCCPLISAAVLGKLRLVRLLLEGGARVNDRNPRGETPLLAACKALRGEPTGPETLKLLTYLLQNKADPNAQDRAGRTPLMYACMERAGAQVASILLSAGADPSMEDYSGASALVYAINAQQQSTLKVLMDACRATGRDIIIIATEMGVSGGPVTRRYLNVPPSPNTSPVSCMSPSDIILKTGSPNSPEVENVFNFQGTGERTGIGVVTLQVPELIGQIGDQVHFNNKLSSQVNDKRGSSSSSSSSSRVPPGDLGFDRSRTPAPRQRLLSEPCLAIHNLARLNGAYEEGVGGRSLREEGGGEEVRRMTGDEEDEEKHQEDKKISLNRSRAVGRRESKVQGRSNGYRGENYDGRHKDSLPRISQSLLSLTEGAARSRLDPERSLTLGGSTRKSPVDKLPDCLSPRWRARRSTLPSLMAVPPLLHLPPLLNQSDAHLQVPYQVSAPKGIGGVVQPHPPSSSLSSSSFLAQGRHASLPPIPLTSSVTSLVAPPASLCSERSRRSPRRHSVQLEQITGGKEEVF